MSCAAWSKPRRENVAGERESGDEDRGDRARGHWTKRSVTPGNPHARGAGSMHATPVRHSQSSQGALAPAWHSQSGPIRPRCTGSTATRPACGPMHRSQATGHAVVQNMCKVPSDDIEAPTLTHCRSTVAHGPTETWKRQTKASMQHAIRGPEGHGDTTARGRRGKPTAVAVPRVCQRDANHAPRGDARTHGQPDTRLKPCCIATPFGKRTATRHFLILGKRLQRTQCRHTTPAEQHSHTPTVRLLRTNAPQSTNRMGSGATHVHRPKHP